MKLRAPTTICWALLALCATAHASEKPKTYRPPRLPNGHVDMQGIWKNSNLTPLERPPEFTQLTITAADAARLKAQYLAGTGGPNQPDDPGRALEDRNIEPICGELRSSQIVDPDDGRIPWIEAFKGKPAALRRTVLNAFDNPEERPAIERCLSSNGAPPMQPNLDGNIHQFVQTPTITVIVSEFTLVIETKYFAPSSGIRLNARYIYLVSPHTTVQERFTRVSDSELNYVFTVSDPTYYTCPWSGETHLLRTKDKMFEDACHEGNYSMRNILEAAR